jgi:hypothetical protein
MDTNILEDCAASSFRIKAHGVKMGVAWDSKTPISTFKAKWCHNPDDCDMSSHPCKNILVMKYISFAKQI